MHRVTALFAAMGLVLLAPIAWGTAFGEVALSDAGLRAVAVLAVVVIGGRVATKLVLAFADTLDGRWRGDRPGDPESTEDADLAGA
ncbi:MAG: hypothetical protein AAFZ07_14955 [Actinomycetota bacterium]